VKKIINSLAKTNDSLQKNTGEDLNKSTPVRNSHCINKGKIHNKKNKKIKDKNKTSIKKTKNPVDNFKKWKLINYDDLKALGFSESHLRQIFDTYKNKMGTAFTTDKNLKKAVQSSIDHFAWAIKNKNLSSKYKNPLQVFMSVLKKGKIWYENGYVEAEQKKKNAHLVISQRQKTAYSNYRTEVAHFIKMGFLKKTTTTLSFAEWYKKNKTEVDTWCAIN
jgi:hypothetical protein